MTVGDVRIRQILEVMTQSLEAMATNQLMTVQLLGTIMDRLNGVEGGVYEDGSVTCDRKHDS